MDNYNLTPHFMLYEFLATSHRNIDNTPTDAVLANLAKLAEFLEDVRKFIGPMHISSGYRSPELNAAVGGAKDSDHCLGLAADFMPMTPGMDRVKAVQLILDSDLEYRQLICEFGNGLNENGVFVPGGDIGWVHLAIKRDTDLLPLNEKLMIGNFTNHQYLHLDLDRVK